MVKFCEKCGTELIDGKCPKCEYQVNKTASRFQNFFVSPKEKEVAVLGNNYVQSFLANGVIRNGFAVVSDKRIYFQGRKYGIGEDGEIEEINNSRVVDLRDVIGTGFDSFEDYSWLIAGILRFLLGVFLLFLAVTVGGNALIVLLSAIIGLVCFFHAIYNIYRYFKSKLSLIVIQYAGGEIAYNVNWFTNGEIQMFQKQLRLAKDKILEREDNPPIQEVQMNVKNGVADELAKLADLLTKGVITQEEFEKMKKNLL